ncbi:MAG: hypothetical protein J6T06_09550 [Victivallales bacterium]|nr:hypothetical protein [Victivallales bacterium]
MRCRYATESRCLCAPLRALARGYDYVALRAMSLRDGIPLPSRGCVSCLPDKCRPPDGRIVYILPRPEGREYRNFRHSGKSCLPGKRRSPVISLSRL